VYTHDARTLFVFLQRELRLRRVHLYKCLVVGGREEGEEGASSEGVCHAHVVMSPEQKLNNFKVDKGNYFARCQMCVRTSVWCPGDDDR